MDMLTRVSLGVRLPEECVLRIAEVQADLKRRAGAENARWFAPSEFLLVLAPLGELSIPQLARVQATLPSVLQGFGSFTLTLEGVGGSPNATQPRVVWIGFSEGASRLTELHRLVEEALAPLVLPRESRPLMAHIDLGRLRSDSEPARSALGRTLRHAPAEPVASFEVSSLALMKSEVTPTGPTLVDLASWPLL